MRLGDQDMEPPWRPERLREWGWRGAGPSYRWVVLAWLLARVCLGDRLRRRKTPLRADLSRTELFRVQGAGPGNAGGIDVTSPLHAASQVRLFPLCLTAVELHPTAAPRLLLASVRGSCCQAEQDDTGDPSWDWQAERPA